MRTLLDRLARVPLWAVGTTIIVSAALVALHVYLVHEMHTNGAAEPPQWLGRLIGLYWALLPLSFIALWARRRDRQGVLGRIGAGLLAVGPVLSLLYLVTTLVWGGMLGRGDLPESVMWVESLFYVSLLGAIVSGIAFLLDAGVRWYGAMMIAAALLDFVLPFGLAAVCVAFGLALIVVGARTPAASHRSVLDAAVE